MTNTSTMIFASQSASASSQTERLLHDLLDRRLPKAFRAMNRADLANGIFFDRSCQQNRMNEAIREAVESSSVGLLLHTTAWQASEYVREYELPPFNPVDFHEHGRHAVGVMFDPSAFSAGEINDHLGLDTDAAGGVQWLRFRNRYAYRELSEVDRDRFTTEIARRIAALIPPDGTPRT